MANFITKFFKKNDVEQQKIKDSFDIIDYFNNLVEKMEKGELDGYFTSAEARISFLDMLSNRAEIKGYDSRGVKKVAKYSNRNNESSRVEDNPTRNDIKSRSTAESEESRAESISTQELQRQNGKDNGNFRNITEEQLENILALGCKNIDELISLANEVHLIDSKINKEFLNTFSPKEIENLENQKNILIKLKRTNQINKSRIL